MLEAWISHYAAAGNTEAADRCAAILWEKHPAPEWMRSNKTENAQSGLEAMRRRG